MIVCFKNGLIKYKINLINKNYKKITIASLNLVNTIKHLNILLMERYYFSKLNEALEVNIWTIFSDICFWLDSYITVQHCLNLFNNF